MQQESAELVALKSLGWLAGNEEILPIFLGSSGMGADELRARAAEPELWSAVLDFLLMDDDWVMSCAQETGLAPTDLLKARQSLPGGAEINWT